MTASFGAVTNLNTHLKQHESTKAWYYSYKKNKKSRGNFLISEEQLNFIKFVISSNSALAVINDKFLRLCLKEEIEFPCTKTFKWSWLEEVTQKMFQIIDEKCDEAKYITIIPDCWSDNPNTHYLGNNIIARF